MGRNSRHRVGRLMLAALSAVPAGLLVGLLAESAAGSSSTAGASPAKTAPTITTTAGYLVYGKDTRRVVVRTTGYPKPVLTLTRTISPATGFSFTGASGGKGVFSGAPSKASVGQHVFTITATNTTGSVTAAFTLTIVRQPTFTTTTLPAFCPSTMRVGSYVHLSQRVADYPVFFGLTLTSGLTGLQFVQNTTEVSGILSGTPTATDAGHKTLVYSADNTITSLTKYHRCKFTVDEPPSFPPSSPTLATVMVGSSFPGPVTISGDSGYPHKTLVVTTTVSGPSGATSLPKGVTSHHHPGKAFGEVINGKAAAGSAGDYLVNLVAANGVGSTTEGFVLVVETPHVTRSTASLSITVPDPSIAYTTTETVTATVTGTKPTGYVQFFLTGSSAPETVPVVTTSGTGLTTAQLTVPGTLSAGTHELNATYTGDVKNTTATASTSISVTAAPTTIVLSTATSTAAPGAPALYTATVSSVDGTPSGSVVFGVNGKTVTATLAPSGSDTATATFSTATPTLDLNAAGSPYSVSAAFAPFSDAPPDWAPVSVSLTTSLIFGATSASAAVSSSSTTTAVSDAGTVAVTPAGALEIRFLVAAAKSGGTLPTGTATVALTKTGTVVTTTLVTTGTRTAPATDPDSTGGTQRDYWWAVAPGALTSLGPPTSLTVALTYVGTGGYAPVSLTFTLTW